MFLKKDIIKKQADRSFEIWICKSWIEARNNMGRYTYTIEKIEAIAEKFRNMPPPEPEKRLCSKQEAVAMLSKEIQTLQKRGYTLDQIAAALRGDGLEITTPTLKSYLQRAQLQKQKSKSPPRKKEAEKTNGANGKSEGGSEPSRATFTPRLDTEDI
jgi:DNA-binding transcriptional MerR regulator